MNSGPLSLREITAWLRLTCLEDSPLIGLPIPPDPNPLPRLNLFRRYNSADAGAHSATLDPAGQ